MYMYIHVYNIIIVNEDITVPEEHRLEECQIHLPFLQLALPIMTF